MNNSHGEGRPQKRRPIKLLMAGTAIMTGLGGGLSLLLGSSGGDHANSFPCDERIVVVDPSSSISPDTWSTAADIVVEGAISAAVCGQPFMAASAVPGRTVTIVSADDIKPFVLAGPNARVRRQRFTARDREQLARLVAARMSTVTSAMPADRSDLAALLQVATDRASTHTHVIVVTDGVHTDDHISLNRTLEQGEGARLAEQLTIGKFDASTITFVGVAQVDAVHPAPSNTWSQEVRSFVEALCTNVGSAKCSVLGAASASEVLE